MAVLISNFDKICADLRDVPGDFAEFGCADGDSTIYIAKISGRRTWAWDTFAGMPDDGYIEALDKSDPPGKWKPGGNPIQKFVDSGLEIVPVVGKYSFTIPRFVDTMTCTHCGHAAPIKFAFVHIDCDHYEAHRRVLAFVAPRMSPGGLIRLDDYGCCPGAKKAVDEWCAANGKQIHQNEWIRF